MMMFTFKVTNAICNAFSFYEYFKLHSVEKLKCEILSECSEINIVHYRLVDVVILGRIRIGRVAKL